MAAGRNPRRNTATARSSGTITTCRAVKYPAAAASWIRSSFDGGANTVSAISGWRRSISFAHVDAAMREAWLRHAVLDLRASA